MSLQPEAIAPLSLNVEVVSLGSVGSILRVTVQKLLERLLISVSYPKPHPGLAPSLS